MSKLLAGIKEHGRRFISSTWWVWVAVIIAAIITWIWGLQAGVFTGIGLMAAVIAFVFLRQGWWFIWGSPNGDYAGRLGWFKKLILLIFPKLRNENKDQDG